MRNSILPAFAAILCILCIHRSAASPNIFRIMSDALGYSDIGGYGGKFQTPVLDKLAANGLRFANFIIPPAAARPGPPCLPGSTSTRRASA